MDSKRRRADEAGFTLIELMVVILIISILIAITVPTYMGARTRAQNRAAQADLRTALVVGEAYYADAQNFDATAADLEAIETDMDFDDVVGNASQTVVGVNSNTEDIVFVRQSGTGTFFCIAKSEDAPGTMYGSAPTVAAIDDITECTAAGW